MTVEKTNATSYANIYGLYDASGKAIGIMEETVAGRWAGERNYYTLTDKYSRAQVKHLFRVVVKAGEIIPVHYQITIL